MIRRMLAALIFVLLLPAMGTQAAGAKLKDGVVKRGVFTSPDGISFTLPDDFRVASQGVYDKDFFRIVLRGLPNETSPELFIDLLEEPRDVREMTAEEIGEFLEDISYGEYWKLDETIVVSDTLNEQRGIPVRETLMVMRPVQRFNKPIRFCFGRTFSTERFFARVTYIGSSVHTRMPEDIAKFKAFFETLVVP